MDLFSGELSTCSLQSWVQVLDVLSLQKSVSECFFPLILFSLPLPPFPLLIYCILAMKLYYLNHL